MAHSQRKIGHANGADPEKSSKPYSRVYLLVANRFR